MRQNKFGRRSLLRGAAGAGTAALLAACAPGTQPTTDPAPSDAGASAAEGEPATIEVVGFYGEGSAEYANFEWINSEFSKAHPEVTVQMLITSEDAIRLRFVEGNPPEVSGGGSVTAFEDSVERIEAGWIYNLEEAMNEESWDTPGKTWWETIHPVVQPLLQVPGYPGVWSFPREVTSLVFFYNTALFDQAGVTPPRTWGEFLDVCQALQDGGVTPMTLDGTVAHGYMEWYFSSLAQRIVGADALREAIQGQRSFTDDGFVQAATMVQDLVNQGFFVDGFSGLDHTGSQMLFYQGQAAMVLVGSWLVGEMRNVIPEGFQQDVFRFPMVEDGQGDPNHIYGTCNVMGIAAESRNRDWGVEWARFFNSVQVNDRRTEDLQYQSAILGAQSPSWMPSLNDIWEETSRMDVFGMGDLWSRMPEAQTRYIEAIGKLFFLEVTPEEFARQVDGIVQEHWPG